METINVIAIFCIKMQVLIKLQHLTLILEEHEFLAHFYQTAPKT